MHRKQIEDSARLLVDKIMMDEKVFRLASQIRAYDDVLFTHSFNVAFIVAQICYQLNYPKKARYNLVTAALLHDVGKLKIGKAILDKKGALTNEEYKIMKEHVLLGEEILAEEGFNKSVIKYMSMHHEKIDGSGYPRGLKDKEFPKSGQILAAVDMYDALTAKRPYHEAKDESDALDMITGLAVKKKYIDFIKECTAI